MCLHSISKMILSKRIKKRVFQNESAFFKFSYDENAMSLVQMHSQNQAKISLVPLGFINNVFCPC